MQKLGRVVSTDVTNMASFYVSSKGHLSHVKARQNPVSITLAREVKGQSGSCAEVRLSFFLL